VKLANVAGRATIVVDDGTRGTDVARASGGRFGPDVHACYDDWRAFLAFANACEAPADVTIESSGLGAPAPAPRQVFAIGLNYRAHAAESGLDVPSIPATFTKFPACLTGPHDPVTLPSGAVDWEVELVVVIGERAEKVPAADAWAYVAGVTIGQDLSERVVQFAAGGQFSLGKSYTGFGPMGPWLVTPDELADPDDLALGCAVDGETMQDARTSDMIFSVSALVEALSAVLPLLPGDVIFTGTPEGIGATRQPPRFLASGEVLETWIEGIGRMRNRME
jgi:2,4-didehydro-3-deoxy-L-rhamnonate hydrolase